MAQISIENLLKGSLFCIDNKTKKRISDDVLTPLYIELSIEILTSLGRKNSGQNTIDKVVLVLKNSKKNPLDKIKTICKDILYFRFEKNYEEILENFLIA